MRKDQRNILDARGGISPIISTVLIVAASLIAFAAVAGYVFGIFGQSLQGLNVTVVPEIYAPQQSIGVLNQNATFVVTLSNNRNTTISGALMLNAAGQVVQNRTFELGPGKSTAYTLTTTLYTLGQWTLTVATSGTVLHPYSFVVEQNTLTADYKLASNGVSQEQTLLSAAGIVVGLLAAAPGIYGLYLRRQDVRNRVMVQRFKEGAYWFIRVNCMKDFIQKCIVMYGERKLAVKEPPTESRFELSLGPGGGENFRFEGALPVPDNDSTLIRVLDGKLTLFKKTFKEITVAK